MRFADILVVGVAIVVILAVGSSRKMRYLEDPLVLTGAPEECRSKMLEEHDRA